MNIIEALKESNQIEQTGISGMEYIIDFSAGTAYSLSKTELLSDTWEPVKTLEQVNENLKKEINDLKNKYNQLARIVGGQANFNSTFKE